jgi:uncharacterized protein DUF1206
MTDAGEVVKQTVQEAAREAAPWVERLARAGYFARGAVYVIVAWLAAQAARGEGRAEGHEGALRELLDQPFGKVLLGLLAVGLAGYALWRLVQTVLDPERKGSDAKGLASRAGYLLTGLVHAGLALTAARLALGSGRAEAGDARAREGAGMLMEQPAGPWLAGLVAVGIAAYGAYQIWRAYRADLGKRLDLSRMGPEARRAFVAAARAGLAARGVVLGVIGLFLLRAAFAADPGEARGMAGALATLRGAPYGPWLLGLMALGLAGYGVFEIMKARYRRIGPI